MQMVQIGMTSNKGLSLVDATTSLHGHMNRGKSVDGQNELNRRTYTWSDGGTFDGVWVVCIINVDGTY